jgi:hypothetical protein
MQATTPLTLIVFLLVFPSQNLKGDVPGPREWLKPQTGTGCEPEVVAEECVVSPRRVPGEDRPRVLQDAITGVNANECPLRREHVDATSNIECQERAPRSERA